MEERDSVIVTGPVCKQVGVDGKEDGEVGAEVQVVTVPVMAVAKVGVPLLRAIKQEVAMEVVVILEDR